MLTCDNKITLFKLFWSAWILLLLQGCQDDSVVNPDECVNDLSTKEYKEGWEPLFDGISLHHWRSYGESERNSGWGVESGCLTRLGWGGDLITKKEYANFELRLDWRISQGGNSGIFIRGDEEGSSISKTAHEMQVLDNAGHWDRHDPTHRAGAYYDMIAPDHDTSKPVGFWNSVYILANEEHIEFWLNGKKTASFDQGSDHWNNLYRNSKFSTRPRYGTLFSGVIGLQDHWDKVWYRALRIRILDKGVSPVGPD